MSIVYAQVPTGGGRQDIDRHWNFGGLDKTESMKNYNLQYI